MFIPNVRRTKTSRKPKILGEKTGHTASKRHSIRRLAVLIPAIVVLSLLTTVFSPIPSAFALSPSTVTFNNNGGSGSMASQTDNKTANLNLNTFTRSGYNFDHWNTAANNSGTTYANGASYNFGGAPDRTLYAQWTVAPSHTVTFNANGGSGSMSPQTTNVPTALTANTFTRVGYTFAGWNTAANGSGTVYADGATYSFAADVTLYAQWTVIPSHTVTFDANGGSGSMSAQTTNVPTALTANTFTRIGYTFAGWNTAANGSGTAYADGATYSFAADVTLYAQWTVIPSHTVTFDANGGSGSMSAQTTNVPTALTANTFTRLGYVFSGWNTAANGSGTAYADGATYSFAADATLYAQWTVIPSHTVTFNANGGSGSMSPQTTNVPTALTANTFTRVGYTFAGWNTAANGSGTAYADGATYSFAADVTLYAQWTVIPSHTVTFNANGGSGSMSPQTTNVPTALTANTFTRVGYTFAGWNTVGNGSGTAYADGATYSFAADVTLYAQWTVIPSHTVTFDANGGSGSMSAQTTNVPTALTANVFTRTGYTYSGWNTAANGSGTAYADGATYSFAADATLYAQWTVIPSHTVTFDANGGSGSMSPQTTNVPTALTANTFTRVGYTFAGWNTVGNGSGTAYADGATYSFAADVTLYAQWTVAPSHTVTFDNNGGSESMSPQTANIPTALTANTFTRTGYTFAGWNTAANNSGTAYADGATYSFAADVTLYAQWAALGSHTVTFDANGGSGSMSVQINNVPTALTANAFTRTGYTFAGWNTAANGSGTAYADGATYSFAADATMYAQWTVIPSHTVTFNANGGSGSMSPQTANIPTALTANTFTRTGYTFAGWNTAANNSGTAYADGATYSFAADVTLYAQWAALGSHTVTFDANGGSGSMSVQINNVPTALTANAFTRTGYTFAGWNTAANGSGTAYADGATYSFAADATMYAQWTVIPSHTVTFNANGGSGSMSPQTTNVATALTANTFTRVGYAFTGWNTAANGSGTAYADGAVYSFAADMTIYAQWSVIVVPTFHTVTFNSNGGSGSMSAQTASVPTALTLNAFGLSGYAFNGWNTASNGTGTAYADGAVYSFTADVILYAQWRYIVPVVVTPAPPAAPPTPLTQTPLVLQAIPTQIPLGAFAALSWTGGSGQGAVTYATTSTDICVIDEHGLVSGLIAGVCTVTATKAGDGVYASTTSNAVLIHFVDLGVTTPAPPEASPGLPSTGLPSTVVSTVKRTVKVSASALSRMIKVNLGAKFAGKKVTIQVRKAGTASYKTLCVVSLNKAGMAQIERQVSKGSALRIMFGGRSLAATIVA